MMNNFFFVFCLFRAIPVAYGASQARGSNWSCSCWLPPQPKQHGIWAASVTYSTAHLNAGSLTHWARPGIEPTSSWMLGSLTTEPWWELQIPLYFRLHYFFHQCFCFYSVFFKRYFNIMKNYKPSTLFFGQFLHKDMIKPTYKRN